MQNRRRTIDSISTHNLTSLEITSLLACNIINGCGAKDEFNFDGILKDNIKRIPGFKKEKGNKLFLDIKTLCYSHDIEFRFQIGFIKANYRFAKNIYKLLSQAKTKWANKKQSFGIALIAFILLCKKGRKAYNKNN